MILILLLLLFSVSVEAEDCAMTAKSDGPATIGKLARIEFEIENLSSEPLAILEVVPEQPCEDPIQLIRSLYGSIQYDKENDQYLYNPLKQSKTSIPISEGTIPPGEKLTFTRQYRPFALKEHFEIQYARIAGAPIYRKSSEKEGEWYFSKTGADSKIAILPTLSQMKKETMKVEIKLDGIEGTESKNCFCEILKREVNQPPFSLYKEWDSGKSVDFRVGEKQEGFGPDRKPAGWKFLDRYEVIFGDGMYMHGEFVRVSPEEAPEFWKQIEEKYSIKRINYFFEDHYYDLEPLL